MICLSSARTVLALSSLICLGLVGCGSSQTDSATAGSEAASPVASHSVSSSSKASSTATASVVASPAASSKPTATPTPGHVTTVTPSPTPTAKGTVVVVDPETSSATPAQADQVNQSAQAVLGSSTTAASATSSSPTKAQTSGSSTAAQTSGGSIAAKQATPACNYNTIRIAAQAVNGAAGSSYITLTFTNAGSTPCSLAGWPEVNYVDAGGQTIGAPATHAAEWTSSGSVLPAGGSAQATLRETRASLYGASCQAVTAAGYRVGIPGTDKSLVLNFPAEACSNKAVAQLSVGQVGATP